MTSKHGKNKVHYEQQASSVTDVLSTVLTYSVRQYRELKIQALTRRRRRDKPGTLGHNLPFCALIGPLQPAVPWYKFRHAGEQATHWDIQNKENANLS